MRGSSCEEWDGAGTSAFTPTPGSVVSLKPHVPDAASVPRQVVEAVAAIEALERHVRHGLRLLGETEIDRDPDPAIFSGLESDASSRRCRSSGRS